MQSDNSLQAFCQAFESKDVGQLVMLFDAKGLCELPLIGQRLAGHGEIREGFMRAFSLIDSCSMTSKRLKSAGNLTIAEGRLQAKLHRDRHPLDAPLAVVMAKQSGTITRLCIYLDARPYRLWSDGPIFG